MFLDMLYKAFYDLALAPLSCFISFHSWPHMLTLVVQTVCFLPALLGFLASPPLFLLISVPYTFFFFHLTEEDLIPSSG